MAFPEPGKPGAGSKGKSRRPALSFYNPIANRPAVTKAGAMPTNTNLGTARSAKKDEFYTQLTDIEAELKYYKDHFRGKTVLCNCDDPRVSNFFRYFAMRFHHFGLKRLIATCYKNQEVDLFSHNSSEKAVYIIYEGEKDGNTPDLSKIEVKELKGDGDFRSQECIELLQQADIVCTNPPFSLFREYVAQLVKYGKEFLIIGNINAISYKEIFSLVMQGKIWLGASIHSGDREFGVPDNYPLEAAGYRVDENGKKYIRVKGVRWFTNMDYLERHEPLELYKKYSPSLYPKYDNYDAINVDKTEHIPCDYDGIMGVPLTFFDKYNPDQFEIIGITDRGNEWGVKTKEYTAEDASNFGDLNRRSVLLVNGVYKMQFPRLLIRKRQ